MATQSERIGRNIRDLRKHFRETQKKLGEVLAFAPNTVSDWERGRMQPDISTLEKIAYRYRCSVEQLISGDFSEADFTSLHNASVSWEDMASLFESMFPIVCSEKALQDPHFKIGYDETVGKNFALDTQKRAMKAYKQSLKESGTVESAANLLCVIYMRYTLFQNEQQQKKIDAFLKSEMSGKDFMDGFVLRDPKALDKELEKRKQDYAREMDELIFDCLQLLKDSPTYNRLADYYLALGYSIGLVGTGQQTANETIGKELLLSCIRLGNSYAIEYAGSNWEVFGMDEEP